MTQPRFTARDIAVEALQEVGAFPPSQDAPDEAELGRAIEVLDAIVDEIAGTFHLPWLVETVEVLLEADKASYPLEDYFTENSFHLSAEHWRKAQLWQKPPSGALKLQYTLPLWRKWEYDQRVKPSTGEPEGVYIERIFDPTMHVLPVPAVADTFTVKLELQGMPRELEEQQGGRRPPFLNAWRRYLTLRTAYDIGGGRVKRLNPGDRDRLMRDYMLVETDLKGYSADNNPTVRLAQAWGY